MSTIETIEKGVCEICSKLTIKTPECRSGVLKLFQVSIVDFEEVNVCWAQLTFTCSKSTIETLEKSVKYVQS